jgi:hypothetical protein
MIDSPTLNNIDVHLRTENKNMKVTIKGDRTHEKLFAYHDPILMMIMAGRINLGLKANDERKVP